jgi:hypothetical protein
MQRYAAAAAAPTPAQPLQAGPFPLVMAALKADPQASTLGLDCIGVYECERGIVPEQIFLQRSG